MFRILSSYFGNTPYPLILLCFAFYLLFEKKTEVSRIILLACGGLFVCFPILYTVCEKIGLQKETYRFFWLLPLEIICAYLFTDFLQKEEITLPKMLLAVFGIFLLTGCILSKATTWKKISNPFIMEQEVVEVSDLILSDCGQKEVRVVGKPEIMIGIRQYSSRLCWAYSSREPMVLVEEMNTYEIPDDASGNPEYRVALGIQKELFQSEELFFEDVRSINADYLVLDKEHGALAYLEENGFEEIAQTDRYEICRRRTE